MLLYYSATGSEWQLHGSPEKLAIEDVPKTLSGKVCMWWPRMMLFIPKECVRMSKHPEDTYDIAIQVNDTNMYAKMRDTTDIIAITGYPTLLRYLHTLLALDCVVCGHNSQRILLETRSIPTHKYFPCCGHTKRIADQQGLRTILMGHSFIERRRSSVSRKGVPLPMVCEESAQ
jgi:hypothetical protein